MPFQFLPNQASQTLTLSSSQDIRSKGFLIHSGNSFPDNQPEHNKEPPELYPIRTPAVREEGRSRGREDPRTLRIRWSGSGLRALPPPRRSNDVQTRMLLAIVCCIGEGCGRHSSGRWECPGSTRHRCWSPACLVQPALFVLLS